jgi:C-terminal processing protease CtpA/Prc
MRGPTNTKIKLRITRQAQDKPIELTIVRQIIRVHSVRARRRAQHASGQPCSVRLSRPEIFG